MVCYRVFVRLREMVRRMEGEGRERWGGKPREQREDEAERGERRCRVVVRVSVATGSSRRRT
jgi:hypothetical protein